MSELKRYFMAGDDFEAIPDATGKWVRFDAAQSELSALREELGQTEAERDACLLMEATLRKENEALIEDRARFPDRPDFIGNMISAHIGNLKAGKESSDNYARNYILKNEVLEQRLAAAEQRNAELEKNAARYVWLRDKSESAHQFYLSTPIWFTGVKFNKENVDNTIDAAMTKPTESGASE